MNELLSDIVQVAIVAGHEIRKIGSSENDLNVVDKAKVNCTLDPQTIADRYAQKIIVCSLRAKYENRITIVGEEGELDYAAMPNRLVIPLIEEPLPITLKLKNIPIDEVTLWVDPLDGTKMFVEKQFQQVSVLIGISVNGKAIAGVVVEPFIAESGRVVWGYAPLGLAYEGMVSGDIVWKPVEKIAASKVDVLTSRSDSVERTMVLKLIRQKGKVQVGKVEGYGATGYMLLRVIRGQGNVFLRVRRGTMRWDICACEAILRALGGKLVDKYGNLYQYHAENIGVENVSGVIACIHVNDLNALVRDMRDVNIIRDLNGQVSKEWIQSWAAKNKVVAEYSIDENSMHHGKHSTTGVVNIRYEDGSSQNVFVKRIVPEDLPDRTDVQWERDAKSYRSEVNFYNQVAMSIDCVPKIVYSASSEDVPPKEKHILVMECLNNDRRQFKSLNRNLTQIALRQIASQHAIFWGLPKSFGLTNNLTAHGGWWHFKKRGYTELYEAESIWESFKIKFNDAFPNAYFEKQGIDTLGKRMVQCAEYISAQITVNADHPHCTFMHGDFKTGNLFFNEVKENVTVIDWQWCGIGIPALDVAYLLNTSVDIDALEHEKELLKYYYDQLCIESTVRDINMAALYSFAQFYRHYQFGLLDYARTAISYFWKSSTPAIMNELKDEFNRGLAYRSLDHAKRVIDKMDEYLSIVEAEMHAS